MFLYKTYDELTKTERQLYQQHPILGQAILLKDEDLELAGVFIRQHHEYLDGSGYPDHLRGDEIELGARIISLCSDFDSYVCGRLEEGLFNPEQGIEFIQQFSGSRYDAELVTLFVDLLQEHHFSDADQSSVVSMNDLVADMQLATDLKTDTGITLLSMGTILTDETIATIKRFESEVNHHLVIHIRAQ